MQQSDIHWKVYYWVNSIEINHLYFVIFSLSFLSTTTLRVVFTQFNLNGFRLCCGQMLFLYI
jgi:hypothetical protein